MGGFIYLKYLFVFMWKWDFREMGLKGRLGSYYNSLDKK